MVSDLRNPLRERERETEREGEGEGGEREGERERERESLRGFIYKSFVSLCCVYLVAAPIL